MQGGKQVLIIVADSNAMDLTARRSSGLHIRCPAPDQCYLCPVALSEPWHLVLLGKWETMDDSVQMVLFLHLYLTCAVLAQDREVTCQILPSYQMCQLLFLYSDIPAHHCFHHARLFHPTPFSISSERKWNSWTIWKWMHLTKPARSNRLSWSQGWTSLSCSDFMLVFCSMTWWYCQGLNLELSAYKHIVCHWTMASSCSLNKLCEIGRQGLSLILKVSD